MTKPTHQPTKQATLTIERLPLSDMKPHPRNPRIHPDPGTPAWETLKRSLAQDYFDPIVWNRRNGLLVSGHLRVKVMLAEGYTHADAVVKDYSDEQHLARLIAANKTIGEDNMPALKDILQELDTGAVDMAGTGYAPEELEELMTQFHVEETDAPELADGDRAPFRQMTFTVHDSQFEEIEAAMSAAKKAGGGESAVNENSNGNALAWICRRFNREDQQDS